MTWFRFFAKPKPIAPREMVRIRMEAIGGQGANSAGKILAESAVLGMGFSGSHFASYGSEKRGSPVQSFVRFSPTRHEIRSAFFTSTPDLIVVFHEAMLALHPTSLDGASEQTILLINSKKSPTAIAVAQGTKLQSIATVDAAGLARKERCGINAVMLGAMLATLPELQHDPLAEAMKRFFAKLGEKTIKRNWRGLESGFSHLQQKKFSGSQARLARPKSVMPKLGYANAPIGGVIATPGNSIFKDNSLSRTGTAPRLQRDICFHCGLCDMVCPDYCFVWEQDSVTQAAQLKGIDYQYCKGCQKCIAVCPVSALTLVPEESLTDQDRCHHFSATPSHSQWNNVDWNVHYPDDEEPSS